MYTTHNYKTKKDLKADVATLAWLAGLSEKDEDQYREMSRLENRLFVYQPGGIFHPNTKQARVYLEGPHYPQPHRWYASGETDAHGVLVRVK